MTRRDVRNDIKASLGLSIENEDTNMPDSLFNTAIYNAMKIVGRDCKIPFVEKSFPLRSGQWEYPIDTDLDVIRSLSFIDSNGTKTSLDYVSPEKFDDGYDPDTNLSDTPYLFTYPKSMRSVIHFWVQAPAITDYDTSGYVTEATIRTLVDSGANFGKTLSGYRIEPGAVVINLTDNSMGYVQVLDISDSFIIADGTAHTTTTTAKLIDMTKDFVALNVCVGDVICTPKTGMVKTYVFVTKVETTQLTYTDARGEATRIAGGDTYKVGRATEIVLSGSTPHPGLRDGVTNQFNVGDATATITGTTFTATRVTGTITGTATAGQNVIASSGQHGLIMAVSSGYLDVDKWIGGIPNADTNCSVKQCDKYQIETKSLVQKGLCLAPTPNFSDAAGVMSMKVLYVKVPAMPDDDDDILEIPDRYQPLLVKCAFWQAERLSGRHTVNPQYLKFIENDYNMEAINYSMDSYAPPMNAPITVWGNRMNRRNGRRFEGASGAAYKII